MPSKTLSGNSQSSHSALMAQGLALQDAGYTQQFRYAFAFAVSFLCADQENPGAESYAVRSASRSGSVRTQETRGDR
jgi:hypothetical protein